MNFYNQPRFCAKTIDVGGAGPVSCLLEARRMIEKGHDLVAIAAGDSITSMPVAEFLQRADSGFSESGLASPFIPAGYNKIAEHFIAAVSSIEIVLPQFPTSIPYFLLIT